MTAPEHRPGDVLGDRYRIDAVLGEGASSTVYAATQLALGRPVAIKVLRAPQLDARSEQRFLREAQAISRLAHPHVVQVHDFGIDEARARAFLVLERVEGQTLVGRLRERGALDEASAARLMAQVARALAHAHARGIVHRDVKPANLMLTDLGDGHGESIKVLDFGLAKLAVEEGAPRLTAPGAALGTLEFASPEQILGQAAEAPSDLYALGCVLFACLTARAPWGAASTVLQAQARLRGPAPALPARLVDGRAPSERLVGLLARLLMREPEARPQDAAQVAAELEALAREGMGAPVVPARPPTREIAHAETVQPAVVRPPTREIAHAETVQPARPPTREIAHAETVQPARPPTREIAHAETVQPARPPTREIAHAETVQPARRPAVDLAGAGHAPTAPTPVVASALPDEGPATTPTALAVEAEPTTAPSTAPTFTAAHDALTPADPATQLVVTTAPTRTAIIDRSAPSSPPPPPTTRPARAAVAGALLVSAALGAWWALPRTDDPVSLALEPRAAPVEPRAPSAPAVAPAHPPIVAIGASPPGAARITVAVTSRPPGASVTRAGGAEPLGTTPLTVELAALPAELTLRKAGHRDRVVTASIAGAALDIALERIERTDRAPDRIDRAPDRTDRTPDRIDRAPDRTDRAPDRADRTSPSPARSAPPAAARPRESPPDAGPYRFW